MPELGEKATCAVCGEVFTVVRSDAEALAEYAARFPELAASDEPKELVCEPCAFAFYEWLEKNEPKG